MNPVCLIIMDGFGLDKPGSGNAISLAKTPFLDELFQTCSHTCLEASGEAVGLPKGQMGNSEVGHLNIGAGRVVYQELTRINRACADGSLAKNDILNQAFNQAKKPGAALHFMGLLSDGGVHSNNAHLYAMVRAAAHAGVAHIMIHCFMDGRDVAPTSGLSYIDDLQSEMAAIEKDARAAGHVCVIEIASISGRYFAMDRDKRWDRVAKAYEAIVCASPCMEEKDPKSVMQSSYDAHITDEFIEPVALSTRGMKDGDAVVFFNFRPDRAREITRALTSENFDGFERLRTPNVFFACLTEYDPTICAQVIFEKEFPQNVLADVIAEAHLRQFHIAETEKYAHVTFFLNGGLEEPKQNEERKLIASPKVATYDLQPEMSEPEVARALVSAIENNKADVYIINFANCDMVGHTGNIPATIRAVEAVDSGVGSVVRAMRCAGGTTLITADHGNADKMLAEDGNPYTAHTTALVPLILVNPEKAQVGNTESVDSIAAKSRESSVAEGTKASGVEGREGSAGKSAGKFTTKSADKSMVKSTCTRVLKDEQGALCDIAPTLLDIMGIDKPIEMTGKSLLA